MDRCRFLRTLASLVLGMVVGAGPLHSQESPQPGSDRNAGERTVSRIFPVRHADPEKLSAALQTLADEVIVHAELGVVTVRASASDMKAVEEALRLIDVRPQPRRSVELIAYLVIATEEPEEELPAAITRATEKLGAAVGRGPFRVLDSIVMRVVDGGSSELEGLLPNVADGAAEAWYRLEVIALDLLVGEAGTRVSIGQIRLRTRFAPAGAAEADDESSLVTEVELPVDTASAVGRAFTDRSGREVYLILIARVV